MTAKNFKLLPQQYLTFSKFIYWSEVANGGGAMPHSETTSEKGKVSGRTYPILLLNNKDDKSIKTNAHLEIMIHNPCLDGLSEIKY